MSALLGPGQRLVSREGDLWRWDGFVAAADAPTAAARLLAEKNRLGDLLREAEAARQIVAALGAEAANAATAAREAAAAEAEQRQRARAARGASDGARDALADFERKRAQVLSRLSAVEEAVARASAARDEAAQRKAEAEAALQRLAPGDDLALKPRTRAGGRRAVAGRVRRGARRGASSRARDAGAQRSPAGDRR